MPELPEVETVRLQLLHKLRGKTISGVTVYHPKTTASDTQFSKKIVGLTIDHIDRVGKLLIFCFAKQPDTFMLGHLKMTGQFFFVDTKGAVIGGGHSMSDGDGSGFPHKHTRLAIHFGTSGTMYFNDMRLFGYLKIVNNEELEKIKEKYGPEPIHSEFDTTWFTTALKRRKTPIKAALLNQSFVAGLGNIYVDEALWRAKIAPTRLANTLTNKEAKLLAKAAGDVMNESIKVGGTTFKHFIDSNGNVGNFTEYLQVFGKQGTPCPRCKTLIVKIRCAGRGTHYCPTCQK
ncbi:MAG: bifunctional DNA-formamidopyrimidine glycosylase/DNA-(apurinic or apyrimidinic site) lyase [Patescibacteria group bacterium]